MSFKYRKCYPSLWERVTLHSRKERGFQKCNKFFFLIPIFSFLLPLKIIPFPPKTVFVSLFLILLIFFYFCVVLGSERKVKYIVFYVNCSFSFGNWKLTRIVSVHDNAFYLWNAFSGPQMFVICTSTIYS